MGNDAPKGSSAGSKATASTASSRNVWEKSVCAPQIKLWMAFFGRTTENIDAALNAFYDGEYFVWKKQDDKGSVKENLNLDGLAKVAYTAGLEVKIPRLLSVEGFRVGQETLSPQNPKSVVPVRPNVQLEYLTYRVKMADGPDGEFQLVEDVFDLETRCCVRSTRKVYKPDNSTLAATLKMELEFHVVNSETIRLYSEEIIPQMGRLTGSRLRSFIYAHFDENATGITYTKTKGTSERKGIEDYVRVWEKHYSEWKTTTSIICYKNFIVDRYYETIFTDVRMIYGSGTVVNWACEVRFDRISGKFLRAIWHSLIDGRKDSPEQVEGWFFKPGPRPKHVIPVFKMPTLPRTYAASATLASQPAAVRSPLETQWKSDATTPNTSTPPAAGRIAVGLMDSMQSGILGGTPRSGASADAGPSSSASASSIIPPGSITASTIDLKDVQFDKKIGAGAFGEVWKGSLHGTEVAIKKLHTVDQSVYNEISIMQNIRHPNLVSLLGVAIGEAHLYLVMEFVPQGSLNTVLHNPSVVLTWDVARNMALDVAKGMNYLHCQSPPVLHRDLKSLNLLVDANSRLKVADFGLGRTVDNNTMTSQLGTMLWMAPEVMKGEKYGTKVDVYSFGVILWEFAARRFPFPDKQPFEIMFGVTMKNLRPELIPTAPEPWTKLMQRCWDADPDVRPSFAELIEELKAMSLPSTPI